MATEASGDPFGVLGLERTFGLERRAVEAAARRRLALLHPDLAAGDAAAQERAEAETARVNAARAMLVDPERRANALLALLGGPGASDDDTLPDGFLMEIMEARQAAEFGDEAGDQPGDGGTDWSAWADQRREALIEEVGGLFNAAQTGEERERAALLARARCALNAWRYIERMREQLPSE